jgi:hypothetical protein
MAAHLLTFWNLFPRVCQKFPNINVTTFLHMVIKKIMEYRDQNHIMKKDVMHLLMLARNKTSENDSKNKEA